MGLAIGYGLGTSFVRGGVVPITQAKAYIDALKLTTTVTPNMIKATNLLFEMLLDLGLYNDTKAIYPILGGTAASHAINAKTPGTYDLTYVGSPVHNANGITTDGATNYINFNIAPTIIGNNPLVSSYNRIDVKTSAINTILGYRVNSTSTFQLYMSSAGEMFFQIGNITDGNGSIKSTFGFSMQGLLVGTKNTVGRRIIRNTTTIATNTVTTNYGTLPVHAIIGGYYNAGLTYSAQNSGCYHICAKGLEDSQISDYYAAIHAAQTLLGRQV